MVTVILDGGSRDLGTSYKLLQDIILPVLDPKRVTVLINQADMGMSGRYWNKELQRPEPKLEQFLDEKAVSVQQRIKEATGLFIHKPICYSANYDYNIDKFWSLGDAEVDHLGDARGGDEDVLRQDIRWTTLNNLHGIMQLNWGSNDHSTISSSMNLNLVTGRDGLCPTAACRATLSARTSLTDNVQSHYGSCCNKMDLSQFDLINAFGWIFLPAQWVLVLLSITQMVSPFEETANTV